MGKTMGACAENIAKVCHAANRAYCAGLGDHSQPAWGELPKELQDSIIKGVLWTIEKKPLGPAEQHAEWLASKLKDGWTYGPVKDLAKKEHPDMVVDYQSMPVEKRRKDALFQAIVRALAHPAPGCL